MNEDQTNSASLATSANAEVLQSEVENLKHQLKNYEAQLHQSQEYIKWVETSKFWKLRQVLIPLKNKLFRSDPLRSIPNFLYSGVKSQSKRVSGLTQEDKSSDKEILARFYETTLELFLSSHSNLIIPTQDHPIVSIVIVLFNKCELTFQCLKSLLEQFSVSFEVIIVDNASSDQTSDLLKRVQGAKIIQNSSNLHFLKAANQGASQATGKYLLFLNNDAQLLPGTLQSAMTTIQSSDDIGAVGGKIVLLGGSLQEAGSIIWQDGSCLGYGRGGNPLDPMYMFQRNVDYCSGALLLTRKDLFVEYGGFDLDYQPAYYEETDYCLKLWENGLRVVYDPRAVILHYEFASSSSSNSSPDPIALQKDNQEKFFKKHSEQLSKHHEVNEKNSLLLARTSSSREQKRILFIDDRVPHAFLGSGYPRSRDILTSFTDLDYFVTFYPLNTPNEEWDSVYQDIPLTTEIMIGYGVERLGDFLKDRSGFYDYIFVSRPHNMSVFQQYMRSCHNDINKAKIIYDAEAVYAFREIKKHEVIGTPLSENQAKALIYNELKLADNVDHIIAVSEFEKKQFENFGYSSVSVLGHTVEIHTTPLNFEQREGILFVGSIHDDDSPNADSVIWFVKEILPLINEQLQSQVKFTIAGFNQSKKVLNLANSQVRIVGKVDDLTNLYNLHRIFVAPTRFAAGIPFKVHHAAAHGIPIITTSLIASQLGWQDNQDVLVADTSETFAKACVRLYSQPELWQILKSNLITRIDKECSKREFINQIKQFVTN